MSSYIEVVNEHIRRGFRELSLRLSPELSQLNGKSILLVGATGAISSYLGRFLINVLQTKVASFQLALTARSEESLKKYYSEVDKSFFKCIFLDVKEPFQLTGQYDSSFLQPVMLIRKIL